MLESIRALDAIVREGSFAAAATKLHKTQSAVSYAVRQLELQLELELFDRSGHRARLNDAGRLVLSEGRQVLAAARRVEAVAARLRNDWEPRLHVVVDGILDMDPIMEALKQMARDDVPTQIQVKVEFLGGVQYRFESEAADVMLVKDWVPAADLVGHPMPPLTSRLLVSATHPLAALETVTLEDLHRHVELSVHDSSAATHAGESVFGGTRVFYLSDFAAKWRAVRMGLGFGWIPVYLADPDLQSGRLAEVAYVGEREFTFTPMLVHRADKALGRAGRRFAELLLPGGI